MHRNGPACTRGTDLQAVWSTPFAMGVVGREGLFLYLREKKEEKAYKIDNSEENLMVTNMNHRSSVLNRSLQGLTAVLVRLLQLSTAKWELPALATTRYLFLAMTFHSRPCPGTAVSMSTMRFTCYRRQYALCFPACSEMCKTISALSVNVMQNPPMSNTTKPNVCLSFRTQVKEGNLSKTSCGYQFG